MITIEWSSDWETGIKIIDEEHFRLVQLLQKMVEEAHLPTPYLHTTLLALSYEVTNHITNHFMHEEHIAPQHLSPEDLQQHVQSHKMWRAGLLQEIDRLQVEIARSAGQGKTNGEVAASAERFAVAIYNFFRDHFRHHDCKFCPHGCLER